MMSSTHWEVQIIIELMISTCPDSSDGRALDRSWVQLPLRAKVFKKSFGLEATCEVSMSLCAKWFIPNLDLIYINIYI